MIRPGLFRGLARLRDGRRRQKSLEAAERTEGRRDGERQSGGSCAVELGKQNHALMRATVGYLQHKGLLTDEDLELIAAKTDELLSHGEPSGLPASEKN